MAEPVRAIAVLFALFLLTFTASAQSARPLGAGAERHAWVLLGGADDEGWRLYHVPPRSTANQSGSSPGSLREVRRLSERPSAMIAVGDRVYLLGGTAEGVRTVRSVWAEPVGFADLWAYMPSDREYTEPPIDSPAPIVVGGTVGGDAAVLVEGVPRRLLVAGLNGWEQVEAEAGTLEGDVVALGSFKGVDSLFVRTGSTVEVRPIGREGSRQTLPLPEGADQVLLVEGDAFAIGTGDGRARIAKLGEDEAVGLCELPRVPALSCVIGIDDPGRIIAVWDGAEQSSDGPPGLSPSRVVQIAEVSSWTGREMYRGDAKSDGPIPIAQIRGLWAAMFMMALVSLVMVIRPDPKVDEFTLPDGFALAGPMRRVAGGFADLLLALFGGAVITGTPLSTLTFGTLMMSERGQAVLVVAVALGLVVCTLAEWRFGRSPGKALLGTRVVRSGGARLRLRDALVRNVCKWLAPPLAVLGVLDPTLRHRGDMLAQAGVVVRFRAPEAGGGDAQE